MRKNTAVIFSEPLGAGKPEPIVVGKVEKHDENGGESRKTRRKMMDG